MKCDKCAKTAVVHMTDLVSSADGPKCAVEMHLCAGHAMEVGIMTTSPKQMAGNVEAVGIELPPVEESARGRREQTKAIFPAAKMPGGLTIIRKDPAAIRVIETLGCPACGITWQEFKQGGKIGCAHDYIFFAARMEGIVKRAHENASQHVGKVPTKIRHSGHGRSVTVARLRRELEQALRQENYLQAAGLRDELKRLG